MYEGSKFDEHMNERKVSKKVEMYKRGKQTDNCDFE
jgi:hypothetical protein